MFNERELEGLIDQAGVFALTNGWQLVIRAEWGSVGISTLIHAKGI